MKFRLSSKNQAGSFLKSGLLLGCFLSMGHIAPAATLLEYWDFNNVTSNLNGTTLGSFATTAGAASPAVNNGEIYNTTTKKISSNAGGFTGAPVYTNGYIDMTGVKGTANSGTTGLLDWGAFSDSAGSAVSGDPSTKQASLSFFTPTPSTANNPTLILGLTSTGYSGLTLSFDARKPGNGSQPLLSWAYSLDGINYTSFTASALPSATGFSLYSITLPTVLDNEVSFQLKASFDFTPLNTGTSFAMDNLQLIGATAVPEPGTVALLTAGGVVLAFLRRRRNSREKI